MNIGYKDIFFYSILVLSLPFLFFNVSMGTVNQDEGALSHKIIGPLGTELDSQEARYYAGETDPPGTNTVIVSRFSDFGFNYDNSNFAYNAEPYCRVGGQYKIQISHEVRPPGAKLSEEANLFYCKTTQDLLSKIQIPSSWAGDNLILYCNDGSITNFESLNFDIFTTQVSVYKACILKNEGLITENTILYGLDSGNTQIDKIQSLDFSQGSKFTPGLDYVSSNQGVHTFKDSSDKEYYLGYDESDSYFYLTDSTNTLDSDLSSIFTLPSDFGNSRVVNFRSFDNGRKAYGYELSLSQVTGSSGQETVYKVKLENFPFYQSDCDAMLKSYGSKSKDSLGSADTIVCLPTNEVLINSKAFNSIYGRGVSFNVFKNFILDLDERGTSVRSNPNPTPTPPNPTPNPTPNPIPGPTPEPNPNPVIDDNCDENQRFSIQGCPEQSIE